MAKLPALISTLSRHDERDRSTLDHIARTVREEGYIPTTKRGVGAAEMTTQAAVNLFLALNGSDSPKDAAQAVQRFRSLRLRELTVIASSQDVLRKVAGAENFGVALEYLIDGSPLVVGWMCDFIDRGFDERISTALKEDVLKLHWGLLPIRFHILLQRYPYGAKVTLQTYEKLSGDSKRRPIESHESGAYWRVEPGADAYWRTEFHAEYLADFDLQEKGFYGISKSRCIAITIPGKVLWDVSRILSSIEPETAGGSE